MSQRSLLSPTRFGRIAFESDADKFASQQFSVVTNHLRVLLAIESSRAYGRGCLRGIASYVRAHGHWQLIHFERGSVESLSTSIQRWQGEGIVFDGVICRLETDDDAMAIRSLGIPSVDLRGIYRLPGSAVFDTDPIVTASLAAEHLLERGFRNFGYCGFANLDFSEQRGQAFAQYLSERSLAPTHFVPSTRINGHATNILAEEAYGETQLKQLISWLRGLPKPVGVMACNDVRGRQIINACELVGLKVPEEVAVVGVDDDEVVCELSNPPLSSVAPDTLRIGYEAARMLDRIMSHGQPTPKYPTLIPPKSICTRLSSDFLAVPDQDLVAALRFIRENACDGINVGDVVRHCQLSRSTLERRFVKYVGIGPKELILRTRFDQVKTLLRETDYELLQIAHLTGFRTTAHLVSAFKGHTGQTPGQFRQGATK